MHVSLRNMAFVTSLLLLLWAPAAMAQTEVGIGTGWIETSGMGQSRGTATANVSGRLAVDLWDLSATVAITDLAKYGTTSGSQMTYSSEARRWFGRLMFVSVSASRVNARTSEWTKNVTFVGGGTGICLRYQLSDKKRPHRDEIGISFIREVHSSIGEMSSAPCGANRLRGWGFFWRHDLPLNSAWFLQGSVNSNGYSYMQYGDRKNGSGAVMGLALVWRPSDL